MLRVKLSYLPHMDDELDVAANNEICRELRTIFDSLTSTSALATVYNSTSENRIPKKKKKCMFKQGKLCSIISRPAKIPTNRMVRLNHVLAILKMIQTLLTSLFKKIKSNDKRAFCYNISDNLLYGNS